MVWYHPSYYKKLRKKLKETKMKTFKQHIKEYKGYAGDAKGVNTAGGGEESIEDGSIGVHNIHEPAVLERVNAFVKSIADREYIKPVKKNATGIEIIIEAEILLGIIC